MKEKNITYGHEGIIQKGFIFLGIFVAFLLLTMNSGLFAQPSKIGINFKISNYGNTTAKIDPAIAYNSQDDEYFVVWFDKTNKQVWGRIIDGADPANSTTSSFRIDGGSVIDPARPAVAYDSDNNQYFVIWETSGSPVQYITGRAYDADGNELDQTTLSYWPGWNARMAYCPDNGQYLIVYVNFESVKGFWVNATNRSGASTPFLIGDSKINIHGLGLAKGSDQYFMVVWNAKWDYNSSEYSGILGNFVHATQNLGSNSFQISWYDGQWWGAFHPDVAFNPDTKKYLVVWEDTRHHQSVSDNYSLYGQYVDQATTQNYHQNNFQIAPKGTVSKQRPAVVFDKAHDSFLVTWDQNDIYGQMVQNTNLVGQPLPISTASNNQATSQLIFNSKRKELLCVWCDGRFIPPEIYGQRIEIVQTITVDKPAAGDVWDAGSTRYIRWHCQNFTDSVRILISYEGYGAQLWLAVDLMKNTPNDGSYEWVVPNNPSKNCAIMIVDANDGSPAGYSGIFEITGGTESIIVDKPATGDSWNAGSTRYIVWHNQNFSGNVKIECSTDSGVTYTTIAASTQNTGSYEWIVPNTPTTQGKVRVADAADGNPSGESAVFTITSTESITLDVPDGGESWEVGTPHYIVWHNHLYSDPVKIEYSTDNGTSYTTIADSAQNTGSYEWTIPNTPSSNCLVKISDPSDGNPNDVSNSTFTILQTITNNTQTGTNVHVGLGSGVEVTFDNVAGDGNTTLNVKTSGSAPPNGFTIIPSTNPIYYDISTTATFTGMVHICMDYDDTGLTPIQEAALKLQVYESPQWVDITTSVDVNANVICGEVNHLTDFAVMFSSGSSLTHFTFTGNTGDSYSIVIDAATLDGSPLSIGDEIGVLTSSGLCVGASVWDGTIPLPLTAWGDDSQTPDVDGYVVGDQMTFKVWSASANAEYPATATYSQGNGNFGDGPYAQISQLTALSSVTQVLALNQGWNWISFNVQPPDLAVDQVMSGLSNLEIVVDHGGQFYIPGTINGIGQLNVLEGYKVYLTSAEQLSVTGQPVQVNMPIPLSEGWNFIGYLPDSAMDAETAMSSIVSNLAIIKNDDGDFYIPGVINDLGDLSSGEGYKLYMNDLDTLNYSTGSSLDKVSLHTARVPSEWPNHFTPCKKTGESYSIVIRSVQLGNNRPQIGDEIGVFTEAGLCVGAGVWHHAGIIGIAAWKDDERTEELDGYHEGEKMIFTYWDADKDAAYSLTPIFQKGNGNFSHGSYADVRLTEAVQTNPDQYVLGQNYPNPFNSETVISFQLPKQGTVELKIFSVEGKEILTLVNKEMDVGNYQIRWDGLDRSGNMVPSGIYIYRLKTGSFVFMKKAILVK